MRAERRHDVARRLTAALAERFPEVAIDTAAVHVGAATRGVGKVRHPAELSAPGSAHESAGHELLLRRGLPERMARFARTHASWDEPGIDVEDIVVSVADEVWKGARVAELRLAFQAAHPLRA